MSRITKKNLKQYVISHLMGNPEECKALNTAGCPIRSGMTVESGRSMVEMLGVLAVIGVLSVAGIAGYSIAMHNYRANEIVNAASMFYVLAKSQNQGNGPSGNIAYADVGGTNPSGANLTYTDTAFTITFTDTDDCTMAANKLGDKATADCPNKTITVNFGETASEEDDSYLGSSGQDIDDCPSGYKHVSGPYRGCAKTLAGANKFCQLVGVPCGATEDEFSFSCKMECDD